MRADGELEEHLLTSADLKLKEYKIATMKSLYSVIIYVAAGISLVGCGSKETVTKELPNQAEVEEEAKSPPPADIGDSVIVPQADSGKKLPDLPDSSEIREAVNLPVVVEEFEDSLEDAVPAEPSKLMPDKSVSKSISERLSLGSNETVSKLMSSFKGGDSSLQSSLDKALKAFGSGSDRNALSYLANLRSASLTPEQKSLAAEIRDIMATAIVERNFEVSGDGTIASIVKSIENRDAAGTVKTLRNLAGEAGLTPGQKELLQTLITDYAPDISAAADSVKRNLNSVNPFGN